MSIKDAMFFEDCAEKICYMSKASFSEKARLMPPEERAYAEKRLYDELDIITGNGFSYEFYIFKTVIDHSIKEKRFTVIGGQAAYSYVAYLLGITSVDPVRRDYPLEMAFDYYHDRLPCMFVYTSPDYRKELSVFLETLFGAGMVTCRDNYIILGARSDIEDHMTDNTIWIPVFTWRLFSEVQEIIDSSDGTFEKIREMILRPSFPAGEYIDGTLDLEILKYYAAEESPDEGEDYSFVLDGTYEGLLRALAVIHGAGLIRAGLRDDNGKPVCTRDDFYRYGLELLGSEKKAFDFMTRNRKGQARNEYFRERLADMGVPDDVISQLKNVRYVVSEGSLIPIAQIILFLSSGRRNP